MSDQIKWNFDNGVYRYEQDLEAARKDQEKIKQLLNKYPNIDDCSKIYTELQKSGYRFASNIGLKFDDYIYEEYLIQRELKEKEEAKKNNKEIIFLHDFEKTMQKQIIKVMRKKEKYRIGMAAICACACLTCFGYFGVYQKVQEINVKEYEELAALKQESANSYAPVQKEVKVHLLSKETVIKTILPDYTVLYEKNPDLVGWIKIDDTVIDYPVVQSDDNEYYLKHSFNKETDANGCIFLDINCSAVENSQNMILYGHHMQSGSMFGGLVKYSDQNYYDNHKYIYFDTIYEKGKYEVMYVFRSKVYNEDEITFKYYQFIDPSSEAEFYSAMNSMSRLSLYDTGVTALYGDKLLTLSTCDYHENKGRFVVVAKKIE